MITIDLDNKNNRRRIKVNPDYNCALVDIFFPHFSDENNDYNVIQPEVSIKYIIYDRQGNKLSNGILIGKIDISSKNNLVDGHLKFEKKVLIDQKRRNDYSFIEFIAEYGNDVSFTVHLGIESVELNIPMNNPLISFKEHLDQEQNSKILFSAPFGYGKTTFIKYFFQEYMDEFEVIHLFPVNYSVASNEDIFQYIKAEVLFQLMAKDLEFDRESFAKKYTFPEFLKENIDDFLIPFFRLIPAVGGSISGLIRDLKKVKDEYLAFHEKSQTDDFEQAKQYVKKLYEKEGSIIEDNFFTQLIRQLNEQIALSGKKTVLVIDDTDRMDPAHIFRVLNVFAAHFDNRDNLEDGYPNKLGFDKIIVVTDMNNLKFIFQHMYGKQTQFEGYINKFYSKSIFEFDNKRAIKSFINDTWGSNRKNSDYLYFILSDLQNSDAISLRELILIRKVTSGQQFDMPDYISQRSHDFYKEISILSSIMGFDQVVEKLNKCMKMISLKDKSPNYDNMSRLILTSRYFTFYHNDQEFLHELPGYRIKFRLQEGIRRNLEFDSGSLQVIPETPNFRFSPEDFYSLLIDLAFHYRKFWEPEF